MPPGVHGELARHVGIEPALAPPTERPSRGLCTNTTRPHVCPSFRAATGFCILPPFLKSRKSHLGSIPGKHPHLALCLPREAPLTPLDFRASIGGRSFPAVIRRSPNVTPVRLRCFVESSSPASESPQPLVYCVKELHKPVKTVSWCAGPELNRLR